MADALHAALEQVPAGVALLRGPELVYESMNAMFRQLVPDVHVGEKFGVSSAQGARLRAYAETVYRTGEPFFAEAAPVQLRDTLRQFELRMVPFREDGAIAGVILLGIEVTQLVEARRAQEEEARKSRTAEQQLKAILDSAPILLFAYDREGRYTLLAGKELTNLRRDPLDVIGHTVWDRYVEQPQIQEWSRRALAGESFTVQIRRGQHTYEVQYVPLLGEGSAIEGVMGVGLNITARLQAEEDRARIQAKMQQAQKLESLGVLAGGIAHDFNNLLTVIQGNASLALNRLAGNDSVRPLIDDVLKAALHAGELTKQMLAYSGKARFQIGPVDFGAVVRDIGALLRTSISRNVELDLQISGELPTVQGDAAQLQQVVMNLVINAAEAIDDRPGRVEVAVATEEIGAEGGGGDLIGRDRLAEGRYVALTVTDTGTGMDPQTQARIFDPFFTTKSTGRGLGLAAVLGIVRSHGGAVRIRTAPGKGTRFEVLLPAAGARAHRPAHAPSTAAAEGTVLIIEDERTVRTATARILASLGYDVLEAENGEQGLEIFRARRAEVDAVVLDLTMPRVPGEATLRALRAVDPQARVLVFSGHAEAEIRERLRPAGGAAVLTKPFTAEQLGAALHALIDAE